MGVRWDDCDAAKRPSPMVGHGCFEWPVIGNPCLYCLAGGQTHNPPCVLGGPVELCGTALAPAVVQRPDGPEITLSYQDEYADAEGDTDEFVATDDVWRYYLRHAKMLVDPCATSDYCGTQEYPPPVWLCRWFSVGESGESWRMFCNTPIVTEGNFPDDDQRQRREFRAAIDLLSRQPLFIRFGVGGPDCFDFEDTFCFSRQCAGSDVWGCIGSSHAVRAEALDHLIVFFDVEPDNIVKLNDTDIAPGKAFPHKNQADVQIKNDALRTMFKYVEQLDAPGHSPDGNWRRSGLSRWLHVEEFSQGVAQPVPYPVVTDHSVGDSTFEEGGTPVTLTCREWITGVELPAHLTLHTVRIALYLHVEARGFLDPQRTLRRTYGSMDITLNLRVKLLDEAYTIAEQAGFTFMDPDNPWDLRIADRDRPGYEHEHLKFIVSGPSGERVPRRVSWRGLKAACPYSRGPHEYEEQCEPVAGPGAVCCRTLQAIENTVLFGELNDHSEEVVGDVIVEKSQRYEGAVTFMIHGLNVGDDSQNLFDCQCI